MFNSDAFAGQVDMTTKGEWVAYTGSDEQIAEINNCGENGYIKRYADGMESMILSGDDFPSFGGSPTHYLICNPHPIAEMICQQARTGQLVWVKVEPKTGVYLPPTRYKTTECRGVFVTNRPDWFMPGAEYSFTAFEE